MKIVIPALMALLVAGCATPAEDPKSAGVRCTREAPLGSSILVTRCRTPEEMDREKAEAKTVDDPLKRGKSGMRGAP